MSEGDRYQIILDRLELLRKPFEEHQISKLPKPTKAQTEAVKQDYRKGIRCAICGGWHHPDVVHLDYVGHAALTDRLLDVDPSWSWEFAFLGNDGQPVIDGNGGMWIKLTVCGISRLGYGDAQGKTGGDAMKERIGDALRNAAMRFGAALDLWHKGDLHTDDREDSQKEDKQSSRIKLHNDALSRNLESVMAVKSALAVEDWDGAAEAFAEITDDDRKALALATTKGGIYTIEEGKKFATEEWREARTRYFQDQREGRINNG